MTVIVNVSPPDEPQKPKRKPRKGSNAPSSADTPETSVSSNPISSTSQFEKFASELKSDYDSYSVWKNAEPFRTRLGMGEIGSDCLRSIWFGYRHFTPFVATPSKSRLFERGRAEEAPVIARLRGIGFEVYTTGPDGAQITASDFGGHYGGRCDGVAIAPERYGFGNSPFLVSVKTSGSGRAFTKFTDKALFEANFKYYTQECSYGYYLGIDRAITIVSEKNSDDVAILVDKLDMKHAEAMRDRAHKIITISEVPPRISNNPESPTCKYCPHLAACFGDEQGNRPAATNCRSCSSAWAVTTGEKNDAGKPAWGCAKYPERGIIPQNVMENGCDDWTAFSYD